MHKLTEVNSEERTAICEVCGPVSIRNRGKKSNGYQRWRCAVKGLQFDYSYKRPYRKFVSQVCQICGFVPEDLCQLDVDHIDGNRKNNDPSNLQTLCANCHRLKTKRNKDYKISTV
jgi:5-methylcytosine-specific restriction endonuclease McrA